MNATAEDKEEPVDCEEEPLSFFVKILSFFAKASPTVKV